MGLNSQAGMFSPEWVQALRGAPESAMSATIAITDPHTSARVYDAETDVWTDVVTVVYTGKARVQPLRGANLKDTTGNATTVQTVLVSLPIDQQATNFRIGQRMEVLDAPLAVALTTYVFELAEFVDSSNEIERTLMFQVNQESVNG